MVSGGVGNRPASLPADGRDLRERRGRPAVERQDASSKILAQHAIDHRPKG